MKSTWDATREREMIEAYYPTIKASYASMVCRQLRHTCSVFREAFDGASIFQRTDTTQWVSHWQRTNRLTTGTQAQELASLRRWWTWLFHRKVIDENVLSFVCIHHLVRGEEANLYLPKGLHRVSAAYETQWEHLASDTRRLHWVALRFFVRFVATQTRTFERLFDEESIAGWVRFQITQSGMGSAARYMYTLGGFTKHLYNKGELDRDPIGDLIQQYPLRGLLGVVEALVSPEPRIALQRLVRPPRFRSCLAGRLESFLDWKRMLGCKYASMKRILVDIDRFLMREGKESSLLTQDLLDRYGATCGRLSPSTRRLHLGLTRQFCLYLKRFEPHTVVPDKHWARVRVPQFTPFIFSPEDFQKLIDATHVVALGKPHPLRAETLRTYLQILYGTGLRPGEAIRLHHDDVDLDRGILTVRETKFFKTRLVPITASLAETLRRYVRLRDGTERRPGAVDFFLRFDASALCTLDAMQTYYKRTRHAAGITSPTGRRAPRLHDLRHSFAVRRLLTWYRQGENVQEKLFLLSTYLGHISIASTQVYLTATAELLDEASHRFGTYAGYLIEDVPGQCHE